MSDAIKLAKAIKIAAAVDSRYRRHTIIAGSLRDELHQLATALIAAHKRIAELESAMRHIAQGFVTTHGDAAVVEGYYRGLASHALLASKPSEGEG